MNTPLKTPVREFIQSAPAPSSVSVSEELVGLLTRALDALQGMQSTPLHLRDLQGNELLIATANGGLHVASDNFCILVFKRARETPSCNR